LMQAGASGLKIDYYENLLSSIKRRYPQIHLQVGAN